MSVDAEVLDGFHDYLGLHPRLVNRDDDPLVIKSKIQDENPAEESGGTESSDTVESPAGRGRIVQLPPGRLTTDELLVPQSQSICGVKGSTILTLDSDSVLTDRTNDESGVAAYVTIGGEFRVRGGIAGQGVLQDLDIDATYSHEDLPEGINKLHGLYAPPREGNAAPNDSANVHTIRNVAVYNAFTNGIHLDQGNDKLVCDRMRSEGASGIGMYLAGGDVKARAIGSVATGTALKIAGAAVEIDQFDLWREDNFDVLASDPTLDINGGVNGCVIKSGTVEGWTRFKGKNEDDPDPPIPNKRFINSKAQFAFVHFKFKDTLVPASPSAYLEAQSADLVELISCKFGLSGDAIVEDPDTLFDYLIMITDSEGEDGDGLVKITGGSGMLRYLGRVDGSENTMRIDAKIHICNMPWRLLFDWGRMGTVEMVPIWAVDSSDPKLRTHLRCDGNQYNSQDWPFAYLNVMAYYGTWTGIALTDDLLFTMPDLPAISPNCVPAIRAIP